MKQLAPFYRGDDFALELNFRNVADQSPVDITGWVFVSTMKLSGELPDEPEFDQHGNRLVLRVVTVAGDGALDGRACLLFPHDSTAELLPAVYQIDVQAEISDSVTTLTRASIRVLSDVTRGNAA